MLVIKARSRRWRPGGRHPSCWVQVSGQEPEWRDFRIPSAGHGLDTGCGLAQGWRKRQSHAVDRHRCREPLPVPRTCSAWRPGDVAAPPCSSLAICPLALSGGGLFVQAVSLEAADLATDARGTDPGTPDQTPASPHALIASAWRCAIRPRSESLIGTKAAHAQTTRRMSKEPPIRRTAQGLAPLLRGALLLIGVVDRFQSAVLSLPQPGPGKALNIATSVRWASSLSRRL